MRLWSLNPRYLDPQGLVALWREGLLAQAVLHGATKGYRNHPQLERFKARPSPGDAISRYLVAVHAEATARGYNFDGTRIRPAAKAAALEVTSGQLAYEWSHLMGKLKARSPEVFRRWRDVETPDPHPLFSVRHGKVEPWERMTARPKKGGAR